MRVVLVVGVRREELLLGMQHLVHVVHEGKDEQELDEEDEDQAERV